MPARTNTHTYTQVDAAVLCECTREDLSAMGITRLGAQKRLLAFARDEVIYLSFITSH